jgi:arabinose-5-phosphate isomerase
MSKNPFTIDSNMLATKALSIMNKNKITQIIVTKNGFYSGIIHLHNIINEGLS